MRDLWLTLPPLVQDLCVLALLLAPLLLTGAVILRGYAPWGLLGGLLRRHAGIALTFVGLIAVSVALGTGLIAQERGLRTGTAQAADNFDLIVAAPGSEVTAMLAAVYLQPAQVALIGGEDFAAIAAHPNVAMAAPIAFGDSWQGAPVVGTIPQFVTHLAGGALARGRMFEGLEEAIAGAAIPLELGDQFEPAHGVGNDAEVGAHAGLGVTVVGKMPATGSPWDRAILVPVESVWDVHGLAVGHPPDWDGTLGPPFAAEYFPGTPAVLVQADAIWANYALQAEFNTDGMMAFFPGAVLARLHVLLGDIRQVMSVMAVVTQVLVAAGVLAGLVILMRLMARRVALLRALGAPRRFVFAMVWTFAAALLVSGSVLGLGLGWLTCHILSAMITARTDILIEATLAWPEFHLVAGFVSLTSLLALLPAALSLSHSPVDDLRAG